MSFEVLVLPFLNAAIGLELELMKHLKIQDTLLLHDFKKHIKKMDSKKTPQDILKIASRIIIAIEKGDDEEKNAWIALLMSNLDRVDDKGRFAIYYSIEEIMINYSIRPNYIENSIFTIYAWFSKYYEDWIKKYPQIPLDNEQTIIPYMINLNFIADNKKRMEYEDKTLAKFFSDTSFLAAWSCAHMLYRCSLNMAELSQENLIRVGNHLSHFSAWEPLPCLRKHPIFDIIYLTIIIQIGAKAQTMKIESIHEKMKRIIIKSNSGRLKEAFSCLEGTYENNIATLGNIDVFLATRNEIQSLKDEIIQEDPSLKNVLV